MGTASDHRRRNLSLCLFLCTLAATAEDLPSKTYTVHDGLLRNRPLKVTRDSHGYLWFATGEGLSIFDGYQFTNYTTADGLPDRQVSDVLETQSGEYWIAAYAGICRYDPKPLPKARFVCYRVDRDFSSFTIILTTHFSSPFRVMAA
jgi:ligand-binding sensor domain-containing protein